MKPITFSPIFDGDRPVDLTPLRPDYLAGMTIREIERLELRKGSETVAVGDLFKVSGNDCENIIFEDSNSSYERIGNGMKNGSIQVYGDAGALIGCHMSGGVITTTGNVGDFCANSMRGGSIRIGGNCGDYLGSGLPGSKFGMNEGCVIVKGDAGIRLGDRMRRGLIVVCGDVEVGACSAMIAGTVILLGKTGENLGVQMRRGSIICADHPALPDDRFYGQVYSSNGYLALMQRFLHDIGEPLKLPKTIQQPGYRYMGDLSYGGTGEIFVLDVH